MNMGPHQGSKTFDFVVQFPTATQNTGLTFFPLLDPSSELAGWLAVQNVMGSKLAPLDVRLSMFKRSFDRSIRDAQSENTHEGYRYLCISLFELMLVGNNHNFAIGFPATLGRGFQASDVPVSFP